MTCLDITFLCQELDRLELEVKTQEAKLQVLQGLLVTSESSSTEAVAELKKLRQQLTALQENYFLSVGRSVKLQGSLVGWYASILNIFGLIQIQIQNQNQNTKTNQNQNQNQNQTQKLKNKK
jgi:hypothetical protein